MSRGFLRSELTGIRNTMQATKRLASDMANAAEVGSVAAAFVVLQRAKFYCPVDTGLLRESGRIEHHSEAGQFYVAEVIFGSEQAFYAVYVHEKPANHKPPTQWKFLQVAIEESTDKIREIIAEAWRRPDFNKIRVGPIGGIEVLTEQTPQGRHRKPTVTYGHPGGHGPIHELQPRGPRGGRR